MRDFLYNQLPTMLMSQKSFREQLAQKDVLTVHVLNTTTSKLLSKLTAHVLIDKSTHVDDLHILKPPYGCPSVIFDLTL
jgi:hypothetical protein